VVREDAVQLTPGRVEVVHNDPARVGQLASLGWSDEVVSLLAVPVVHDGEVRSTIEVVSQRSRQVSDWDVALARVVADRLAAVVAQPHGPVGAS
jgi:GAF domain-containing protein